MIKSDRLNSIEVIFSGNFEYKHAFWGLLFVTRQSEICPEECWLVIDRRKEVSLANQHCWQNRTVTVNFCSQRKGGVASVEHEGALPRRAVAVFNDGSFHFFALARDHTVGIALCKYKYYSTRVRHK